MIKKYSNETKEKVMSLYKDGLSANMVAKQVGVNEATVRNWLKINNITIRDGGSYNIKHGDETVEKIIELYNKGIYTTDIDKLLNIKRGIASYVLRKHGIQLRHRGPKSQIDNECFFDAIDNEIKAYFLGWIMADGNISITDGQYSLKLHISLRDRELIDRFLECINSSNKTSVKEGKNPSYYVSLTSVHMCKSLISLGVIPRKSGKEVFPEGIPSNLHPHFIRGVFDGDGITCVGKSPRSGFVGSKEMLVRILETINAPERKIIPNNKNENIYYFLGGKNFSRKLYEFLYKDSTIWLQRKRERLEKICFE
jgi:transposase-like protein